MITPSLMSTSKRQTPQATKPVNKCISNEVRKRTKKAATPVKPKAGIKHSHQHKARQEKVNKRIIPNKKRLSNMKTKRLVNKLRHRMGLKTSMPLPSAKKLTSQQNKTG